MPVVLRKRKAPAPTPPQAVSAPTPKKQKTIQTASKAGKDSAAKAAAKLQLSEPEAQPTTPAAGKKKAPPSKLVPAASKKTKKKGTSAPKKTSSPASSSPLTAPPSPSASPPVKSSGKPEVGQHLELDGFGGEVQLNDGTATTLKALVDASQAGVVIFTYPRASTPGCTNQACLFRDSYAPLTAGGLAIYGLSTDSTKANSTFQQKQNLPYPLICDPQATLIGALGLKKSPKGTQRGVFLVAKDGKVLALQSGGPAATVDVVRSVVAEMGAGDADKAAAAAATDQAAQTAIEGAKETAQGVIHAKEGGGKEDGAGQEGESAAKVEAKDDAETEEDPTAPAPEAKAETHTKKKAAKKDEPKKGSRRTKAKASASKEDQETEVQEKV